MPQKTKTSSRTAYKVLAIATFALAINFWAWDILSPLGNSLQNELSLSPSALALLLATPVLVGSLGRIPLGALTDRFGGRIMFSIVTLLTALPVIGLIFAGTYLEYILVAIVLGLGGATFAIGVPYISKWFPKNKQGLALGIYGIGDAGTALAVFLMPPLILSVGRDTSYWILIAFLIVSALAIAFWGKNSPTRSKTPSKGSFTKSLKSKVTWDLSLVYAITFGAFVAFGVYLPVLLKTAYGLTMTDAALRAGGFILLATFARPLGGWLSDKIGGKYIVRVSLILIGVLASVVAYQPTLAFTTTVTYLSLAFVLGACSGAVFALVGRAIPVGQVGSATGIIGALGGLGGFIPPLVLGLTYEYTHSYSSALSLLGITAFIVFIYTNRRFKNKRDYSYIPGR